MDRPSVLSCKTFLENTGQIALWYAYTVIFNRQDNSIIFLYSKGIIACNPEKFHHEYNGGYRMLATLTSDHIR